MDWLGETIRCAQIRTVMTNIIGFSELLADPVLKIQPQSRREYAEIIHASGQSLTVMIEEILHLSAKDH